VTQPIDRDRLRELAATGAQVVEVLPEDEFRSEHLPSAISLPLTRLDRTSADRLDRHRPIVVYCADSG
jgi:rhodanese-related sulfurtransferase